MTDRDTTSATGATPETHHEPHGSASPHGAADDIAGHDAHGGDDGHGGHGAAAAGGPIDVAAWTAGAIGIALGLIVVLCLVFAERGLPV